MQNTLYVFIL